MCCNFCTGFLPRRSQQHLDEPHVCVNSCSTCSILYAAAPVFLTSQLPHPHRHGGTPKAPHCSASSCQTSLLLPKGSILSSLRLSTRLISQLHAPLWACRCAPHPFTPLHTYLSTPACKYLHVADLAYLMLFSYCSSACFHDLESLALSCQAPGTAQLAIYHSVFPFWGPLRWRAIFTNVVGQTLE